MDPTALRPIGRTTLRVTQFGFGTAPLSGFRDAIPEPDAIATTAAACDGGVRLFDTSPYYGYGLNEADTSARFVRAGNFDCVLLAGRYTLLQQGALADFLPLCVERGVSVVI